MAACTPSIHVFLGRSLFRLSSGTHSKINFGIHFSGIFMMWPYHKCPFYIFIKSKLGNCGIKVWVATDTKSFHAYKMQTWILAGLTEQGRRRRGLQFSKMWFVSHMETEQLLPLIYIFLKAVN
jgi:Zn-finger protein